MIKKYNYMKDSEVNRFFITWINSPDPMLLEHPADRIRFYQFIKGCFSFVRRHPYGSKIDLGIFNECLINSLRERYNNRSDNFTEEFIEKIRHKAYVLFESIIEYEDTKGTYIDERYRKIKYKLESAL